VIEHRDWVDRPSFDFLAFRAPQGAGGHAVPRIFNKIASMFTALLLALGALLVFAPTSGAQGPTVPGTDCGTNKYRFTFWPKGHKVIKSYGHPAYSAPHMEVYPGTGKKFSDAQQVAHIDVTTSAASTAAPCVAATVSPTKGTATKVTTKATLLVCTFDENPVIITSDAAGGDGKALVFAVKGAAAAFGYFQSTGVKLNYDPKQCKAKKPPH
jgi:hypothetical protein